MMDPAQIKRAVFIPDCHIGIDLNGSFSHDVSAFQLMLDVINEIKPYYIFILGDFCDFYSLSAYVKDPGINQILKDELFLCHENLSKINAEKKHFISGNHEFRLEKYIANKCSDLFDVLTIKSLLKLDDLQFIYHEFGPNQLVQVGATDLYCRHEPFSRTSEASGRKSLCNIVSGHNHAINRSIITAATGESFESISCGSLVNMGHPVFSYLKTRSNWQTGFGVATILQDNSWFYDQIHIKGNKCLCDGTLFC